MNNKIKNENDLNIDIDNENEYQEQSNFIQEYKPTFKDKLHLFLYKINPINLLQEKHTSLIIKERENLLNKIDDNDFLSDDEFSEMAQEKQFLSLKNKAKQIDVAFKENNVLKIRDMYFAGDISYSDAYLSYYHSYNKMYDNWVAKKREEETKELNADTKITNNRREHNKNLGKNITKEDYHDLFNVIQSSYLLMLVNFKQLSIKCEIDTMLLLQIIDKKLMDYQCSDILRVYNENPKVTVLLEFIPFSDNSSIVRINAADDGIEVFHKLNNMLHNHKNQFIRFIKNNHKLISLLNEEYQIAEHQGSEQIENSFSKTQNENLAIATFTYVNNYNILLEETHRGVIVGVQDMRTILESIKEIDQIAIQKKNETVFKAPRRIVEEMKEQREIMEKSDNENKPTSYTLKVGENKRNYEIVSNIKTAEELLSLIRKKHLYVKLPQMSKKQLNKSNDKVYEPHISKKRREKIEQEKKFKIELANEDKVVNKK